MKKRLVSFLLAISMVLTFLPVSAITAFAANDDTTLDGKTYDCGKTPNTVTATLTRNTDGDDTYTLTISGTGEMANYDYRNGTPWEENASKITTVVIGEGVTSIGNYAFENCSQLSSVTIPDGVTSIGEYIFSNCNSLTSVKIPESVESISVNAFGECKTIESFTTSADAHFFARDGVLYEKTSEGNALRFYPVAKNDLTFEIPNYVTSIGTNAFVGCQNLTNVTIPNNVTSIGEYAFQKCAALKSVTIPATVASIAKRTFENCKALESVTIEGSIASIGEYAFAWCNQLSSVTIPNSVTTIEYNAFYGCSGLEKVYYTGTSDNWNAISSNFPSSAVVHYVHSVTFKDGNNIVETKLTNENGKVTAPQNDPIKEGYTFAGWSKIGNGTDLFDFDNDFVETDTVFYAVWKKDCTLNMTVAQGEHKVDTPVTINVEFDPGEYTNAELATFKAYLTFTDADGKDAKDSITEVKLGDKVLADKGYNGSVLDLMKLFAPTTTQSDENNNIITVPLTVTFKDAGNYTAKIQVTNDTVDPELNLEASAPIEIKKEEKPSTDDPNKGNDKPSTEPEKPNPDDTKKDDDKPKPEEPETPVVKLYDLTVKNAEVTIADADGKAVETTKNEDGTLTAKVPEGAKVTVKYTAPTDAIVFDLWSITSDAKLDVNVKENPLTFTMPDKAVTIEAMTRDATIESEGPGILGTAAMIGVGVAGTAVLGYQGYMIGTELYLNNVLPAGAAIPQNYGELAKLVWNDAGRPEPIALLAADATDEQKALTWAVENQLISADKAADASVTRWEVIQTWNQEQEMKKV